MIIVDIRIEGTGSVSEQDQLFEQAMISIRHHVYLQRRGRRVSSDSN